MKYIIFLILIFLTGEALAEDPCNFSASNASECNPGGQILFGYDVTEDFGGQCYITNFYDFGQGGSMDNFLICDLSGGGPTSNSGNYTCPFGSGISDGYEVVDDAGGFCNGSTHVTLVFTPITTDCPKTCNSGGSVSYTYYWGGDPYGGSPLNIGAFSSDTGGSFVYSDLEIGDGDGGPTSVSQTFNCPVTAGIDIGLSITADSSDENYPIPSCSVTVFAPTPTPTPTPTPAPAGGKSIGRKLMGVGN